MSQTLKETTHRDSDIDYLRKENMRLMELISNMVKDGYTYDQLNRKMIVCESCGELLKKEII